MRKRNVDFDYDKDKDESINMCLNCTEKDCKNKCQKIKCIGCKHRVWFGDYSLYYCGITQKVIYARTICPLRTGVSGDG